MPLSNSTIKKSKQFFYYYQYPIEPWPPVPIVNPVHYSDVPLLPDPPKIVDEEETFFIDATDPPIVDQDEISPFFRSSLLSKFSRPNKKKIQPPLDDGEAMSLATSLVNNYVKLKRAGLPINPQMAQLFKDIHLPASFFKSGEEITK